MAAFFLAAAAAFSAASSSAAMSSWACLSASMLRALFAATGASFNLSRTPEATCLAYTFGDEVFILAKYDRAFASYLIATWLSASKARSPNTWAATTCTAGLFVVSNATKAGMAPASAIMVRLLALLLRFFNTSTASACARVQ